MDDYKKIRAIAQAKAHKARESAVANAASLMHKHNLPEEVETAVMAMAKQVQDWAEAFAIVSKAAEEIEDTNVGLAKLVKRLLEEREKLKDNPGKGSSSQ